MSNVLAVAAPLLAHRVWPWSSSAASALAEQAIATAAGRSREKAWRYASDALARSPVDARAAGVLGLLRVSSGRPRAAQLSFSYSQRLSRRELQTQMWFIEQSVAENDVQSALDHYNIAMQTSRASRALLLPVLEDAAENPAVAKPLSQLLQRRPNWWLDFYDTAIPNISSPASLMVLISALHFNPADPLENARLRQGMQRLVTLGAVGSAYHIYQRALGIQSPAAVLLRNGGFEGGAGLPPFDWQLSDNPDYQGIIEPRDGSKGSASLSITGTSSGEVARQLLMLAPGHYEFSLLVGEVGSDTSQNPSSTIVCLGGVKVMNFQFPSAPKPQIISKYLDIPDEACSAQWLIISSNGNRELADPPWVDDIAIRAAVR